MEDIQLLLGDKIFKNIFCVASFHHLDSMEKRIDVLQQLYNVLEYG